MPATVDASNPQCFLLRLFGEVELDDVRHALGEIRSAVVPPAGWSILADGAELGNPLTVSELAVITGDLRDLAARGLRRGALLVPRDLEEIARMFATFAATVDVDVKLFRSVGDARTWLLGAR